MKSLTTHLSYIHFTLQIIDNFVDHVKNDLLNWRMGRLIRQSLSLALKNIY